jgi:glucose-1-phosphate cytidylyltransferase
LIATGYKGFVIEEWVSNLKTDWQVKTLDTGLDTQTGGRIKKCMDTLPGERIMVTYGDGLGNININELLNFHLKLGKLSTVTAVRPPARFGVLESSNGVVTHFGEKKQSDVGWINGGFFILEPKVSEFVENDLEPFESHVMPRLVEKNNLAAYHHEGFWQPMDTLREKNELSELVKLENPPWLKI